MCSFRYKYHTCMTRSTGIQNWAYFAVTTTCRGTFSHQGVAFAGALEGAFEATGNWLPGSGRRDPDAVGTGLFALVFPPLEELPSLRLNWSKFWAIEIKNKNKVSRGWIIRGPFSASHSFTTNIYVFKAKSSLLVFVNPIPLVSRPEPCLWSE